MSYAVKEMFYTLQGEGARSGRAAVFCRFAGCNLWTGREADRERAICQFCDTDFVGIDGAGGGRFEDATALAAAIRACWADRPGGAPYVVCTGGEPLLQLDVALIEALHREGFEIAIETNGTLPIPSGIDWVCVSPKAGSEVVVRNGNELKLVFPQPGADPEQFESWAFDHFYLQPIDSKPLARMLRRDVEVSPRRDPAGEARLAIEYCMTHPRWMLSLQTHKILGIP